LYHKTWSLSSTLSRILPYSSSPAADFRSASCTTPIRYIAPAR
jgi:hypothetical protein